LWLTLQNTDSLKRWQSMNLVEKESYVPGRLLTIHGRILIFQKKYKEALDLLNISEKQAAEKNLNNLLIETLIQKSLAYHSMNNPEDSFGCLGKALQLAEPQGYIRIFLDEGKPLKDLLSAAVKRNEFNSFLKTLLSLSYDCKQEAEQETSSVLIEPLSEREREVLKYLKTDLTGPEIADQLYISLSTVRTHTKNIFEKLMVNNRRSAVTKAKEIGI